MKEQMEMSYSNPFLTVEMVEKLITFGWEFLVDVDKQKIIITRN